MPDTTTRLYTDSADLQAMIDLIYRVRPPEQVAHYPSSADLQELLPLPEINSRTRLWHNPAGQLVAWAFVDTYNNLRWELDPAAADPALEDEIVAWGLSCVHRLEPDEPLTLDASCRADDAARSAFLQRHGFSAQPVQTLHLARPLDGPIPAPQLPPGMAIRPALEAGDVEALAALHRAAFGTSHMTAAHRQAMIDAPGYMPELDLVAVAPDGRLAAYCLVSISAEENARSGQQAGYTDPVATHPAFRRMGLARALLLAGMQRLKERGMAVACLGTSSENEAMQAAARSAGFYVEAVTAWYARPVKGC